MGNIINTYVLVFSLLLSPWDAYLWSQPLPILFSLSPGDMQTFPLYFTRHLIDLSSFIAPVLCFPQESLLACPYSIPAEFWITYLV